MLGPRRRGVKNGILLVNLGSPVAPTTAAVRRYLREFLSDPRVVDLPKFFWWIILNLIILPFRSAKSAKAYRKIWTDRGSPLVAASHALADQLDAALGDENTVRLAMRYGKPEISANLAELREQGMERLVILPLYPQYSNTTTASVFDAVLQQIDSWPYLPEFHFINGYHRNAAYLDAVVNSIRNYWDKHGRGERLLLSFHGLPAKSIDRGDPYFHQCNETAFLVTAKLGLKKHEWQAVFQSRFGRAEWLKPYCVDVLQQLPAQGITRIDVVCPGFAVDCLETLEEIAMTNQSLFIAAGGNQYRYIPALNASREHVQMFTKLVEKFL